MKGLCRELKERGYTKQDVKKVVSKYKDKYEGQIDSAGLIRDGGGKGRFWREIEKIQSNPAKLVPARSGQFDGVNLLNLLASLISISPLFSVGNNAAFLHHYYSFPHFIN